MSRSSVVSPGDLVRVPMSVRLYASIIEQDFNTYSLVDKEDANGYTDKLAIVIGIEPATMLFILGQRPRWRWCWPGSEHLLVKENLVTVYGKANGTEQSGSTEHR